METHVNITMEILPWQHKKTFATAACTLEVIQKVKQKYVRVLCYMHMSVVLDKQIGIARDRSPNNQQNAAQF